MKHEPESDGIPTENPEMANQTDAIDWSVLDALKVLQKPGRPDVRDQLMTVYLASSPSQMENIKAAVSAADGQALRNAAHALKSSSLSIGAKAFGSICVELEQCGKSDALEGVHDLLKRAELEFSSVCSAFGEALKQKRQ